VVLTCKAVHYYMHLYSCSSIMHVKTHTGSSKLRVTAACMHVQMDTVSVTEQAGPVNGKLRHIQRERI
jgi:hypothetical protein